MKAKRINRTAADCSWLPSFDSPSGAVKCRDKAKWPIYFCKFCSLTE